MRKLLYFVAFILFTTGLYAQNYTKILNPTLKNGELLTYRIAYNSTLTGSLTAGKASLEVRPDIVLINNQNCVRVTAKAWTTGFIEFFYKLNNKLESFIDVQTNEPIRFTRSLKENKYRKEELVEFNRGNLTAKSKNNVTKIVQYTQDVVSVLYFARTLSINNLRIGQYFQIPYFLDDSVYYTRIVFEGKEKIKTHYGEYNCIKFKPLVEVGNVFSENFGVSIWLTDDQRRIPILIKTKLKVGEARLELINSGSIVIVGHKNAI